MNYPIDVKEINRIALKFNCWVSIGNILFYRNSEKNEFRYAGKFYYKDSTGYFHITDVYSRRYPGGKNLEELFTTFKQDFTFQD
jgi:hypothetical protein